MRKRLLVIAGVGVMIELGLRGPRQRLRLVRGAGEMVGGLVVPAPARLGVEAAQTEQARVLALRQLLIGLDRAVRIAGELGGLGPEHQGERIVLQLLRRPGAGPAGGAGIAGVHGDQTAREGLVALLAAAAPRRIGDEIGQGRRPRAG